MPEMSKQVRSRRSLLQAAGAGAFGLNLGSLWQAQAAAAAVGRPADGSIKACIFLFHYGGPSHLDTFDLKPKAPAEVRGGFSGIPTSNPDLRICEHLPMLAKQMHRFAVVRSMHHRMTAHDSASSESLTGRTPTVGDRETFDDTPSTYPSFGATFSATYSRLHPERAVPLPWAALPFRMNNLNANPGQTPGFLGSRNATFQIDADPEHGRYHVETLRFPKGIDRARMEGRRALLDSVESVRSGHLALPEAMPTLAIYEKAFNLLESEDVRRALDIESESLKTRERYGLYPQMGYKPGPVGGGQHGYGRNMRGQNLLLARRLVEAGVPFVNVYDFKQQGQNWDSHTDNFNQLKDHLLPPMDRGLSALIEDLDQRGLLESTLVVSTGEFGRTPKINGSGGRDHWPFCYTTILAGGGVKGGTLFGSSDETGAYPDSDGVTPADLGATLFWRFGLDPKTEVRDTTDRPFPLSDGEPVKALFGR